MGVFKTKTGSKSTSIPITPDSNSDAEKTVSPLYSNPHDASYIPALEGTTEGKLLARIDWHIMPCVIILFFLSFLDKVNIGNASTLGMLQELNMTDGNKYSVAVAIFFVPYTILEIPANLLMKKFTPHVWLSMTMIAFGVVSMCQGFVQSYGGLLAVRFFLGVAETSSFPACFYLISMWYKRSEAQRRFSFFFSSASLAGAFGGLLAAAIGKIPNGTGGYSSWRWIFILEGLLTVVFGVLFWFILTDFPEDAKWLNENERAFVKARLHAEQGSSGAEKRITFKDVISVFKDYKVILAGLMYFSQIIPAYGYAYFAPSIIKGYGYNPIQTQLHSVPPWATAWGFSLIIATFSDFFKHRYIFAVIPALVAIAGLGILITVHNNLQLQYAALFLTVSGIYSSMPVMICWSQMNLSGHHRRAVAVAWQIGFGNIGGIPAVFLYPSSDAAKHYMKGYSTGLAFMALSIVIMTIYFAACIVQNKKKSRMPRVVDQREKEQLGDLDPDFRYLL